MAIFDTAYRRTHQFEGGDVLATVQFDRGGETYGGISRAIHPRWGGWPIIDRTLRLGRRLEGVDGRNLADLHRKFYLDEFWIRTGCDVIDDQDIANELYDSAVNCGARRAVEWLQSALNVCNRRGTRWGDLRVDGALGPMTAEATDRACKDRNTRWLLLQVFESFQRWHYVQLALLDPTQEEFIHGWFRKRVQQFSPPE